MIGQHRLGQADHFIAVNAALVFQAFLDADPDLCRQPVMHLISRGANGRFDKIGAIFCIARPLIDSLQDILGQGYRCLLFYATIMSMAILPVKDAREERTPYKLSDKVRRTGNNGAVLKPIFPSSNNIWFHPILPPCLSSLALLVHGSTLLQHKNCIYRTSREVYLYPYVDEANK